MNPAEETAPIDGELYRCLPSINELLLTPEIQELVETHGRDRVLDAVRTRLAELRDGIATGQLSRQALEDELTSLTLQIGATLRLSPPYSLRPVINATGVILHTNLGRAPLSESALAHIVEVGRDYSNLEFDLETGERSKRDVHAELLLLRVLGVPEEDLRRYGVVVVNNCAAATCLALNTLAEKREVVVSRGELVEIGGGFRIPEILEKSGAFLREVGTTNRTRVTDYEEAVTEQTALLLRVHQSNFCIEGFVERPSLEQLVALAQTLSVPLFEDQGTGLISGLDDIGIADQPTLRGSIAAGVALVAASGDKLLGGPQCGILVGRSDLISQIRKNPLLRTFRVDKLTYAALEATIFDYLANAGKSVPLMRMLHVPAGIIEQRCHSLANSVHPSRLYVEVIPVESIVGGGTAPSARLTSYAVSLRHLELSADQLLQALRKSDPPIVARISDDRVILDLRTVPPQSEMTVARVLNEL